MSAPSLVAKLGISEGDFIRGLSASEAKLAETNDKAKLLAAQMALLEQRMAGGKTDALVSEYKALNAQWREATDTATAMARQLKALEAIKPPAMPAAKLPDDSAAYEAWLRRADEQARSARAHAAMANVVEPERLPMPVASRPQAVIRRADSKEKTEESEPAQSGGTGRAGQMEAAHSIRAFFGSIGAGQSFSQAAGQELPKLLQAAGTGLGTMIGVEAAASIIKGVVTASEKAREFIKEYSDAFTGGPGGVGTKSKGSLHNQIDELGTLSNNLNRGGNADGSDTNLGQLVTGWLSDTWEKVRGRKSASEVKDDQIEALEQRRIQLSEELARRKAEQVALDKRAAVEGEAAVAVDRERLALRERIAAVVDDKNLDGHAQSEMIDSLREESKQREENIRLAQQQKAVDDELRHSTAQHRLAGDTDPVKAAEEALESATKKRDALTQDKYGTALDAVKASEAYKAADDEVTNRQAAARESRTARAQRNAENSRRNEHNSQAGSSSDADLHRNDLRNEERDLLRQVFDTNAKDYEADEQKRALLSGRLLSNQAEQKTLVKQENLRAIDTAETEDRAHTSRGPEAALAYLRKQIEHVEERRLENRERNGNDEKVNADLDDKLHELTRAIEDLTNAENSRLAALSNEKKELGRRGYVPTWDDKDQATDRKFDRQKQQAQDRHASTAELDAIEANRAADHLANAADEAEMTPEQRAARGRANDARDRAVGRVQSGTGKTKAAESGANVQTDDFVADAAARRQKVSVAPVAQAAVAALIPRLIVPNRIDEIKAGAANAGKGDVAAVDNAGIIAAINSPEWAKNFSLKNRA